eukprot:2214336-Rhodomonas_salina.1
MPRMVNTQRWAPNQKQGRVPRGHERLSELGSRLSYQPALTLFWLGRDQANGSTRSNARASSDGASYD